MPSDWLLSISRLRTGSGIYLVKNETWASILLPVPAPRCFRRKLILSPAPVRISLGLVRRRQVSHQHRGRGVGNLLRPNQLTLPPTTISRPVPSTHRNIPTLTTWKASPLRTVLVTMDVGRRVGWGRVWVIGGSGMMKMKTRMRWKVVSFHFFRNPRSCAFISFPKDALGRCLCDTDGKGFFPREKSPEKGREIYASSWASCISFPRPPFFSFPPSVWMAELLPVLFSLLFCLCLAFILLPFSMLYHSQFLLDIDVFLSVKSELPPAKRRKGLAGTIVSTALSAALIGTAVGLTMYRL